MTFVLLPDRIFRMDKVLVRRRLLSRSDEEERTWNGELYQSTEENIVRPIECLAYQHNRVEATECRLLDFCIHQEATKVIVSNSPKVIVSNSPKVILTNQLKALKH
ncbi:hypothetical protein J6590_054648 [Homalodisca vitripennis]|nr:hypothetical protein J6590_054648 [Homalodisca vitripennis]